MTVVLTVLFGLAFAGWAAWEWRRPDPEWASVPPPLDAHTDATPPVVRREPVDPTAEAIRSLRRTIVTIAVLVGLVTASVLAVQAHNRAERRRWIEEHCAFDGLGGVYDPRCP